MAYDTLSDPEKREVYDRYGEEGLSEGRGGGGGGGMDDILQSMFGFGGGGGRGRQRQRKTEDMKQAFPVSLEQFYNGVTRKIKVTRKVVCTGCGGVGGKKGSSKPCRGCDGHGVRVQLMQVGIGMVQQVRTACTDCDGTGEIIAAKDRCQTCNGKKVKAERKALEVHIDKGMKHGQNITFRGEGEQEPGLEPGDVVLVLQQKEHETFTRKGNHLIMNKTVSLTEALCGLTFHVKHLDGRVLAIQSIPGNVIRPGTIQIVKGEGMPQYRDVYSKGDLLIKCVSFEARL